jgi:hypothetical protein
VLSRELQRFHAVLGLQNVVAVRLDQIVEELHVELVVFDDQDRLLGRAAALFFRRHLLPLKHWSSGRKFPGTNRPKLLAIPPNPIDSITQGKLHPTYA